MSEELVYTSVPRGLKQGSSGFCMVAMSEGMREQWVERLEMLSGYRPVFPLGHPSSKMNPVNWAHWHITVGGRTRSVLSRIAFAGADYSQRSNKFAHHLVLEPSEQPPAGPAWLMMQPEVMLTSWEEEPRYLPDTRALPSGDQPPGHCKEWEALVGDAGWAGALAETFRDDPTKPAYLIFSPGTNLLPLFAEALALLPQSLRWQVTFSTYFTGLPAGTSCNWRGVVAGSASATEIRRPSMPSKVFDLTKPLGTAPDSALARVARTGMILPESDYHAVQQLRSVPSQIAIDLEDKVASRRHVRRRSLTNVADAVLEESPAEGLESINFRSTDLRTSRTSWFMPSLIGCVIGLVAGIAIGFGLSRFSTVPAWPALAASENSRAPLPSDTQHHGDLSSQSAIVQPVVQAPATKGTATQPTLVTVAATTKPNNSEIAVKILPSSRPTEPAIRTASAARTAPIVKTELVPRVLGPLSDPMDMKFRNPPKVFPCDASQESSKLSLHFPDGNENTFAIPWNGESLRFDARGDRNTIHVFIRETNSLQPQDIATIQAENKQINFSWEQAPFGGNKFQQLAPVIQQVLSISALVLSDNSSNYAVLTFLHPSTIPGSEDPKYGTCEIPVSLPAPIGDLVRLDATTNAGGGWIQEESSKKDCLNYSAPLHETSRNGGKEEFQIRMILDTKKPYQLSISRNWQTWPSSLPNNRDKLRADIGAAQQRLGSLKSSSPTDTERLRYQSKLKGLQNEAEDCESKIQLYSQIKDITVRLTLPNGVVVAEVVVPKPELPPPATKRS